MKRKFDDLDEILIWTLSGLGLATAALLVIIIPPILQYVWDNPMIIAIGALVITLITPLITGRY